MLSAGQDPKHFPIYYWKDKLEYERQLTLFVKVSGGCQVVAARYHPSLARAR